MAGKFNLVLAVFIVFLFSTCKKGEDDPAISLRTRKARLTGDWRLVKGNASLTTDGYNDTYDFDGSNVRWTSTLYYPSTGRYLLALNIKKDGTFSIKEIFAGTILDAEGNWNFNTGVGDAKKKESVLFSIDKVNKGYTYGNSLFNRYSVSFVYSIKELRNKALIIKSSGKIYSDVNGKYITMSTEYEFQQ